ncbi:hypothetical protein VTO42DRAFT_4701 [Malbranchea cinnamomea]
MSIDINWEAATSGPDGAALAERIRSFIHDKFQQVSLPRFIRSVEVTGFDFGTVSPELEIRDICDPFSDFYEEDEDEAELSDGPADPSSSQASHARSETPSGRGAWHEDASSTINSRRSSSHSEDELTVFPPLRSPMSLGESLNPYFFPRSGTPGIPGGISNLGYYYMPLSGFSGTQTPLASVARGPVSDVLGGGSLQGGQDFERASRRHSEVEVDSAQSRPSTSDTLPSAAHSAGDLDLHNQSRGTQTNGQKVPEHVNASTSIPPQPDDVGSQRMRERRPDDLQVFCRVRYAGNIKLSLTALILLDYPMPSFVALPLKLNITGLTFDGVAVLAYIRRRVHLCFLAPEDASALLGPDENSNNAQESQTRPSSSGTYSSKRRTDSLLRDIRVESEIGRKENGKQVLKNVGKVEKFVLEQVRRIFEEEFVYPSFWTFLV